MSWNTCKYDLCENWTTRPDSDYCETHRRAIGKAEELQAKAQEKRNTLIAKQREKAKQPRKTISKNPADWNNTFLCSDGTRVTERQIERKLKQAYNTKYPNDIYFLCEGCGRPCRKAHAHIIAKARCKQIGKTDLIWHPDNFFRADNLCNSLIENPKGKGWKNLLNIEKCLSFIKQHDPELYAKFELSAVNQSRGRRPHSQPYLHCKRPNEYI